MHSIDGELLTLRLVLEDALPRLTVEDVTVRPWQVTWSSWEQVWSDTSCGFGGMAGQVITTARTHVVGTGGRGPWAVYHGGRWAYTIREANEAFHEAIAQQNLCGAADGPRARYKQRGEGSD